MARPRKQVDPNAVESYAALGFTMEEIGVLCDVSVDTLERRFADAIKKGRLKDKVSYMRKVRHAAFEGPVPHLGFCALYAKLKGWYVERIETVQDITTQEKVYVAEWGGRHENAESSDEKK